MKENFGEDDFKNKREGFAVRIRKQKREEQFNRKRMIDSNCSPQDTSVNYTQVLDERFATQIRQYILFYGRMLEQQFTPENFDGLAVLVKSSNHLQVHRGIIGFRKLTSMKEGLEIIKKFTNKGLIDKAIQLIEQKDYPHLRMEATWVLANIASGPIEYCEQLVQKGMVDRFMNLLRANEVGVVDQAVWGIGNLGAQSPQIRDKLLNAGVIKSLIQLLSLTSNQQLLKNTIWAICNLCRGSPRPTLSVVAPAIPILCQAAVTERLPDEIQGDCYLSISSMTQIREEFARPVVELGLLPILMRTLATATKSKLYIPALKVIGNMSMSEQLVGYLIQAGIFDVAIILLDHEKICVKREICWILSNLLSNKEITMLFMNHENIKRKIVEKFRQEHSDVKREICWIISNIVHTGKRKLVQEFILKEEILGSFVTLLGQQAQNFTIQCCLECLGRILKIGDKWAEKNVNLFAKSFQQYGGGPMLESLQSSETRGIYQRVGLMLQKYFQLEDTAMTD